MSLYLAILDQYHDNKWTDLGRFEALHAIWGVCLEVADARDGVGQLRAPELEPRLPEGHRVTFLFQYQSESRFYSSTNSSF